MTHAGTPAAPPPGFSVNTSLLIDAGHNMAGFGTFTFTAPAVPAGTAVQITLKHSEITGPDGNADNYYYPGMGMFRGHAAVAPLSVLVLLY